MKLITLFFSIALLAITLSSAKAQYQTIVNGKNALTFSPLNFTNVLSPSINVGYQRQVSNQVFILAEYGIITQRSIFGYIINSIVPEDNNLDTYAGHKFKLEGKYLLSPFNENRTLTPFCAVSATYTYQKNYVNSAFIVSDENHDYSFNYAYEGMGYDDDYLAINRRKTVNFKFGLLIRFDRFSLEPNIGTGIAFNQVTHENRENVNDDYDNQFLIFNLQQGNSITIDIPWDIRLGFVF